jgi:DNA repair protein RecO (recombination protein O)
LSRTIQPAPTKTGWNFHQLSTLNHQLRFPLMIERAHGLVLRTRPFTETSLIVNWLTVESGRISTVAKGACRPKSPLRGKLDLFYEADFTFRRSRRSELHTLGEVSPANRYEILRRDLGALRQAAYCAALIEQTTEKETPLPRVYELIRELLQHLSETPLQSQTIFAFELKLLDELGLKPDWRNSKLTPGSQQIVKALIEQEWPALARMRLSAGQTTELRQFLHGFLLFHLGRIPRGRASAIEPATI